MNEIKKEIDDTLPDFDQDEIDKMMQEFDKDLSADQSDASQTEQMPTVDENKKNDNSKSEEPDALDAESEDEDEKEESHKLKTGIIVLAIAILAALLGIILFLLANASYTNTYDSLSIKFTGGEHEIPHGTVISDEETILAELSDDIEEYSGTLSIDEPFHADELGNQTITLKASDKALFGRNVEREFDMDITVIDANAPVITLTSEEPIVSDKDDCLNGIESVIDDVDGAINFSDIVIDDSAVDYSVSGDYTVTANVKDSSGNEASIEYKVKVSASGTGNNGSTGNDDSAANSTAGNTGEESSTNSDTPANGTTPQPKRDTTAERTACENNSGWWNGETCEYIDPSNYGNHDYN